MHRLTVTPDKPSADSETEIVRAVGRRSRSLAPGELSFFFSRRVDALAAARRLAALGLEGPRVVLDCPFG